MYIFKNKFFLIILLSLFLFTPTLLLAYVGAPIPGYEGNTTSPKGCETNTIREGGACLWEVGSMSWCGFNAQVCQIEPIGPCPNNPPNGTFSFSCNTCDCQLNCNPGYQACENSCIAEISCEANEVFDACANSCVPAPSQGSGYKNLNPFFFLAKIGFVGIGTSSPLTKLHLFDNRSGPIISLSGSNTNYRGLATRDLNNTEKWFIGNNNSNNFVIRRNGSANDLFINSSGNIGIGTDNPATKLHVNGTIRTNLIGSNNRCLYVTSNGDIAAKSEDCGTASGGDNLGNHTATQNLTLGANYISNTGANAGLNFDISNNAIFSGSVNLGAQATNTNQAVRADRTISPGTGLSGGGNLTSNLTLSLTNTGVIAGNYGNSNNVPVITIDAQGRITSASTASITSTSNWSLSGNNVYRLNGNVGLGTSSPSTKLHLFHATSGPIISLSGIDSNYRGLAIRNLNNAERWFIGDNENSNFVIRRQEADSNDIVVNSDGNVGIGTDNPATKLHVVGATTFDNAIAIGAPTANNHAVTKSYVDDLRIDWDKLQHFPNMCNDGEYVTGIDSNLTCSVPPSGSGSLWLESGNNVYRSGGNVGIGTSSPNARLHISTGDTSPIFLASGFGGDDLFKIDNLGNIEKGSISANLITPGRFPASGQPQTTDYIFSSSVKFEGNVEVVNYFSVGSGIDITHGNLSLSATGTAVEWGNGAFMSQGDSYFTFNGSPFYFGQSIRIGTTTTPDANTLLLVNGQAQASSFKSITGYLVNNNTVISSGALIRANNGSASTPAFSFLNDTNTGIFRPTSGQMGLVSSGTEVMRIATSSVAIGTTSPKAKLHLYSSSSNLAVLDNPHLIVEGQTPYLDLMSIPQSSSGIRFVSGNASINVTGYLFPQTPNRMTLTASGGFIFSGGNVGIGTTSPATRLHVNGGIRGQYQSSDGSLGITQGICFQGCDEKTCCINIKNGIIVDTTCDSFTCASGGGAPIGND